MGNGNGGDFTKAELQDMVDQAIDVLTDAYAPESSREDLAGAIGDVLDILNGSGGDDTDSDDMDDGDAYSYSK
jgi:hypothetical protein